MAKLPPQKTNTSSQPRKPEQPMATITPSTPRVHDLIGQKLRNFYNEVALEPVPDRFAKLLEQLEQKTESKKNH